MSERLYPVPDKTRTSWCFLVLETKDAAEVPHLVGWELAVANAHRVIDTVELRAKSPEDEVRLLTELCAELEQYQHDNTTLHTIDDWSLSLLRTRLAIAETDASHSLRGFYHVPIRDVLDLFGPWWKVILETIDVLSSGETCEGENHLNEWGELTASDLWTIRCSVAPLVPVEAFEGDPL